ATVASNARWGSRPMAEHRVMSEDLLGKRITDREDATNRTQTDKNQRSIVSVCIDISPALCAKGHGTRIPCAFRVMLMRLPLAVEGCTTARAWPVKLTRAEG